MKDRLKEPSCACPEGQTQNSNKGETGYGAGWPVHLSRRAVKGEVASHNSSQALFLRSSRIEPVEYDDADIGISGWIEAL
jgi:hypothetical protein